MEGYKAAVTQQESAHLNQSGVHDDSPKITSTITLVTREREHAQVSLVEAYFNGKETSIMVDTGSTASMIHYNDPTQDRIFKIEKKRTCSYACKGDDDSTESRETNIEIASVKRNTSRDISDEEIQELLPDVDETPASLLLNAIETRERTLGQSDHSAKHSGEYYKMYKVLEDTVDDSEDDDDMIENMPMSNEKEATNNIENDQRIVENDHEAIGRDVRTDNVIESVISGRNRIQIYLDDIVIYEDENEETSLTQMTSLKISCLRGVNLRNPRIT